MSLVKLLRLIKSLSNGDPLAWGLVGFTILLIGTTQVIRHQAWFVKGGDRARQIAVFAFTLVSILAAVVAVILQRTHFVSSTLIGSGVTW